MTSFNLGTQELIILVMGGLVCAVAVIATAVLAIVLTLRKEQPRND